MKEDAKTENPEEVAELENVNELDQPIWAVIGFDRCFAKGLTYEEAAEEIKKYSETEYTGLCIVTDKAASRLRGRSVL